SAVTAMMPMTCQRGRLSMIASCRPCFLPSLFLSKKAAEQTLPLGCRGGRRQNGLGVVVGLLAAAHRLAAGDDVGDGLFQTAAAHALCEFHLQLALRNHLGNEADDAAAGDDAIAALDSGQHLALRLHLGLLRTNQQEVEDDEDQDEREELHEEVVAAAGTRALRPSLGYEHRLLRSIRPPKSARTIAARARFATRPTGDMVAPFSSPGN